MAITAALLVVLVITGTLAFSAKRTYLPGCETSHPRLTFKPDGTFKVVSFSDMHFGERWGNGSWAPWGPQNDAKTQQVHATVLDVEKPDYVVFNGDLVTGENLFAYNATGYIDQVFKPTVDRKLPFSSTYGNHDNANNINHAQIIGYEQAHYSALSRTRSDVGPAPYGNGNYWIPAYAKETDLAPALIMWFFDSRSFVSGTGNGPAADYYWVDENTVPAYIRGQAAAMKAVWGGLPPSLVFVHIPFQHAANLTSLPTAGDHDDDDGLAVQGYNATAYTGLDIPTFQEILNLSGSKNKVLAITSGHDHGESWCGRSKQSAGLAICFNGHSGYGGYTTPHSLVRNGRVFNLNLTQLKQEYPTVTTWNSYEDRTRNQMVVLGKDYLAEYN